MCNTSKISEEMSNEEPFRNIIGFLNTQNDGGVGVFCQNCRVNTIQTKIDEKQSNVDEFLLLLTFRCKCGIKNYSMGEKLWTV